MSKFGNNTIGFQIMPNPLVSIIMPAYHAVNFILESLNSIKKQSYTSWEIIVVEDASDDGTEEIVYQFGRTVGEDRVKYFHHAENQGVSATRNTAMEHAKGNYLAFLDCDDLWRENHLETAIHKLNNIEGDIAYSTAELFNGDPSNIVGHWGPSLHDLEKFPASLLNKVYIPSCSVVMKRIVYDRVGNYDKRIRAAEDLDYWLRIAEAGFRFIHIPGIYVSYRKNISSLTSNTNAVMVEHAKVLQKHNNNKIIARSVFKEEIVQCHIKAIELNYKKNLKKSADLLLWILKNHPISFFMWFWVKLLKNIQNRRNVL